MITPDWQWNEMQQVGTDYTDPKEIAAYDARMTDFRDVDAENRAILTLLDLPAGAAVLEIGCGTGRFSRAAAKAGLSVTAVDISAEMLEYVAQKSKAGALNIRTQHAGFLSMDVRAGSFDAAVSGAALHHLPDAWKLVALRNVARALKPGGQLVLRDVVFVVAGGEAPERCLQRFADSLPTMREAAARHVAREFSTYDWIIEGLLQRAGFEILSSEQPLDNFMQYHCRKALSVDEMNPATAIER